MRRGELFIFCTNFSLETAILGRAKDLLELPAYHIFILFSRKVPQRAETQAAHSMTGLKKKFPLPPHIAHPSALMASVLL